VPAETVTVTVSVDINPPAFVQLRVYVLVDPSGPVLVFEFTEIIPIL
jgi:hypothetical protein